MRIRRSSFGGHSTAEPGAGKAELMSNDVNRFAGGEGHFGRSQTSEVVHFDDLREGGVLARQGFEGLVHLEDFHLMTAVAPLTSMLVSHVTLPRPPRLPVATARAWSTRICRMTRAMRARK